MVKQNEPQWLSRLDKCVLIINSLQQLRKLFSYNFKIKKMKAKMIGLLLMVMCVQVSYAQQTKTNPSAEEQRLINLSNQKWLWMADKNVDSLSVLFDAKAMFVHMGGTWGKDREIEIIKTGFIWYKKAEVYSSSVRLFGNMAIVLNDIDLVAVVGGNEVTNPFMVTEVYFNEKGKWKIGQLTFSHLARPVKLSK